MRPALFALGFAGALCLASSRAVVAAPSHIEAEYRITSAGLVVARVKETYVRKGDTYRIESVSRAEGPLKLIFDETVTYQSEGRVGPAGLVPMRFEQRQVRDPSRDVLATFDWKSSLLHSQYRGESRTEPLPPGTQDRLSVMYQFMNFAPGGNEVRVPMSNGRKVEMYAYRKVDDMALATPAGSFETVHFERVLDHPGGNQAQLWLAKDHFNFPVRVVFVDSKGLRLDQQLVSLVTR